MSLLSGFKKLARKVFKVAAPVIANAIPIVGPILGPVVAGAVLQRSRAGPAGPLGPVGPTQRPRAVTRASTPSRGFGGGGILSGRLNRFGSLRDRQIANRGLQAESRVSADDVLSRLGLPTIKPRAGQSSTAMPGIGFGGVAMSLGAAGAARAAGRVAGAAIGRAGGLPRIGREVAKAVGFGVVGDLLLDNSGQPIARVKKRRRINPLNTKALNRAISRVCAAKKICDRVDKIVKRPVRRRRRSTC